MTTPYWLGTPYWLELAPEDEQERRDYFIRLITLLALDVSTNQLRVAVQKALGKQ